MADQTKPAASPNLGNALVGIAGVGARVAVAGAVGAAAATRAALRPASAATRTVLRSPPGTAVRNDLTALLDELDAAGRRDLERARVRVGRLVDNSVDGSIDRLLNSPRSRRAVERLLESEELWLLVDRIANSAEVLDAITSTSVGLAGEVADEARRRTATADDVAERIARRLLRRAPREASPTGDAAVAERVAPQR